MFANVRLTAAQNPCRPDSRGTSSALGIEAIALKRVVLLDLKQALQIDRIVQALVGCAGPEPWRRKQPFTAPAAAIPPPQALAPTEAASRGVV